MVSTTAYAKDRPVLLRFMLWITAAMSSPGNTPGNNGVLRAGTLRSGFMPVCAPCLRESLALAFSPKDENSRHVEQEH